MLLISIWLVASFGWPIRSDGLVGVRKRGLSIYGQARFPTDGRQELMQTRRDKALGELFIDDKKTQRAEISSLSTQQRQPRRGH